MLALIALKLLAAPQAPSWSDIRAELQKPWPQNHEFRVVCHGHSVPAGYFVTPKVDTFNAYPHLLHQVLKKEFTNAVINVVVTAIGGENSVQGEKRFMEDVMSLKPRVVTIDYALNDRGVPLDQCKAAWQSMITTALRSNAKVILLTPTPDLTAKMLNSDDPLTQRASMIRDLAKQNQVSLADPYAAFSDILRAGNSLEPYMSQFNHPNRKGHDVVVKELAKVFFSKTD
ncbi:MAG: SGNH/GDSL hydrolase family protein [Armatimonadota bacterium]